MKINKAFMAAGIVTTVAAGSLVGVSVASAHTNDSGNNMVEKLVERFSLNEAEVQAVFDEAHEERHADMEARHAEQLANLVEDGTLTQEQADSLQALRSNFKAEVEEQRESDADHETIKEAIEKHRAELEAWAETEGLDLSDIRPGKDAKHGRRMHGGFSQ